MKLLDDLYLVGSGRNGFGISADHDCHIYLIDGGAEAALIDAGVGLEVDQILKNISRDGIPLQKIKYILLTHGHADHSGGAQELKGKLGCKIFLSKEEASLVERGDEEALGLRIARASGFYPPDYKLKACPIDRQLDDSDVITVGKYEIRVISTPGHSKGSVSFLLTLAGIKALFVGDTIQFGDFGEYKGMIALLNAPGSDVSDYAKGIQKLKGLNIDALLPGHRLFTLRKGQRQIDFVIHAFEGMALPRLVHVAH